MTVEGRPRSTSFSSTPTFSSDLAKLKSSLPQSPSSSSSPCTVSSYKEAIAIASTFDVLGNNSTLTPKLKLTSEDDWIDFFQKSGAVDTTTSTTNEVNVNMEKFLRYCFDMAYKMPPSPSNRVLREHVRGASGTVPSLSI
mmetsp:Transcript_17443/g.26570  ORF Transcript_17443/g.26570 Transcript_17443/m.26570 type:complete len:140 (+) Transcript_17443:93-512(+)